MLKPLSLTITNAATMSLRGDPLGTPPGLRKYSVQLLAATHALAGVVAGPESWKKITEGAIYHARLCVKYLKSTLEQREYRYGLPLGKSYLNHSAARSTECFHSTNFILWSQGFTG